MEKYPPLSHNARTQSAAPSCCLCWSPSHHIRIVMNWFLVNDLSCQIMNWCNMPTPYHVVFLAHHISSCWQHTALVHCNLFTNLYFEDQLLLLTGLHLFHLHVPIITTHLRTGRGGAMMGRAGGPYSPWFKCLIPMHCIIYLLWHLTHHLITMIDSWR